MYNMNKWSIFWLVIGKNKAVTFLDTFPEGKIKKFAQVIAAHLVCN